MILLQKNVKKVAFRKAWREEQRIVKLGVLAETLEQCCGRGCSSLLDFRNRESEKKVQFV